MKAYIVHSDVTKLFYDEQALVKYLNDEKSKRVFTSSGKYEPKLDFVKIETVNVEVLEETYSNGSSRYSNVKVNDLAKKNFELAKNQI